jgi:DNA-binding GntR family transcriptional regulator
MSRQSSEKYDSIKQPTENKQSLAYQQIKQDILNNTYPEGTIMVERKLCEIYNMSRSPIRNALQQLAHEGLLTFVPGKGVVVSSFTTEDILEVYNLIEILQTYAVNACIGKCNPVILDTLKNTLEQSHEALSQNDIYQCTRWDQKFHGLIISYSGNHRLETIYDQLNCQEMLFISTILDDHSLAERSYQDHCEIYKAIDARDVEAAQRAIKTHYQHIKQYYINKLLSRIQI